MSLTVLDPGLCSLVVDRGRTGSRSLGLPLGGAADRIAFQLGNCLLGNDPNAPALELTLKGPTLRSEQEIGAIVFGAPFVLRVSGRVVEPNTTFLIHPGETLQIGGTASRCRAYLAVAGGFQLPTVLGAKSGLEPIKTGEVLKCNPHTIRVGRGIRYPIVGDDEQRGMAEGRRTEGTTTEVILRTLPGVQADWFSDREFFQRTFRVSPASNRMGVRLTGEPLTRRVGEMVSEPVSPGAVQVMNDGLPVILGVDGQTIGGYPKVAHVIRADFPLLGQLRPGDQVRFELVTPAEAEAAAALQARQLRGWQQRLEVA